MQASALHTFFTHLEEQIPAAPNEVRRLFHGRGRYWPGLEQITCDWLQGQLLITVFKEVDDAFKQQLVKGLQELSEQPYWLEKQPTSIVIQSRYLEGSPCEVIWGELDDAPVVVESGLKYQLKIGRNQNFGLFLDMRNGRDWVKANSDGAKVLNLFAYTCGFSVAAIAGGAKKVVNVDMARGALNTGRDNHRLNEHDMRSVDFLGYDIFKSWGKIKKGGPYELIIIDPPSFQKGSFALTKDYSKILRRLPDLLTDNGQVLACVNSPMVEASFLVDSMMRDASQIEYKSRLQNPAEFIDTDSDSCLKVLLFQKS
ncbi:methyltransferase [Vibrio sp. 10N.286.49.B3]|uniref:class I SAM-dependent methyltransferase n=1 Tax=Vibrio sp. 10N.286.49.B3 TaxID=1880855 RepID=UPI000C82ABD7|nr:class I SAM-dependent methyltransferase [Vibrio sp. 10N.286.49.B3]PMH46712.1 methyltransferase [Vibrio sp. 10N.286.49.B3]